MSPIAAGAVEQAQSPSIVSGAAPGPGATPDGNIPAPGTTPDPTGGYGKSGPAVATATGGPDPMPVQQPQSPAAPTVAPGGMFGKGGFMPAPQAPQTSQPTQNPMIQKPAFQSQPYPTLPGYNAGAQPQQAQQPQRGLSRPTQNPMIRKPAFQGRGRGRVV